MNCPFCQESLEEHEAGRCMDAWVLLSQGGWKLETKYVDFYPKHATNGLADCLTRDKNFVIFYFREGKLLFEDDYIPEALLKFSTDMNEAIKLWDKNWLLGIAFQCWVVVEEYSKDHLGNGGNNPALAICKAFIKEKR